MSSVKFISLLLLSISITHALPKAGSIHQDQNTASKETDCQGVRTTSGRYLGHSSPRYPNVTEYLGIRYAQPPINDLRFAAPVPFISNETFEASEQPDDCPYVAQTWGSVPGELLSHAPRIMAQESADGYNAVSEDCLGLNMWAPSSSSVKKPVMVFVYGGGE